MSGAHTLHRETFPSIRVAVRNTNLPCCRRGGSESIIADMPFVSMCFDDKCDFSYRAGELHDVTPSIPVDDGVRQDADPRAEKTMMPPVSFRANSLVFRGLK